MRAYALASLLVLAGCSHPAPTPANTQAPMDDTVIVPDDETPTDADDAPARDYTGRWTGVEGMYLVVSKEVGKQVSRETVPGRYRLEMRWDLDHRGRFDGTIDGDAIGFVRNGVSEVLKPGDGAATGLKYLAGKKDCLTVKPGEGYCRD